MKKQKYRITRDVTPAECKWLKRTVRKGEVFTEYTGRDYGCISPEGVALEGVQGSVFSEIPQTALCQIPDLELV